MQDSLTWDFKTRAGPAERGKNERRGPRPAPLDLPRLVSFSWPG